MMSPGWPPSKGTSVLTGRKNRDTDTWRDHVSTRRRRPSTQQGARPREGPLPTPGAAAPASGAVREWMAVVSAARLGPCDGAPASVPCPSP